MIAVTYIAQAVAAVLVVGCAVLAVLNLRMGKSGSAVLMIFCLLVNCGVFTLQFKVRDNAHRIERLMK